jgi:hypothetical protein
MDEDGIGQLPEAATGRCAILLSTNVPEICPEIHVKFRNIDFRTVVTGSVCRVRQIASSAGASTVRKLALFPHLARVPLSG